MTTPFSRECWCQPSLRTGFTLIEVIFAMAIFVMSFCGISALYFQSFYNIKQTRLEIMQSILARDIINRNQIAVFGINRASTETGLDVKFTKQFKTGNPVSATQTGWGVYNPASYNAVSPIASTHAPALTYSDSYAGLDFYVMDDYSTSQVTGGTGAETRSDWGEANSVLPPAVYDYQFTCFTGYGRCQVDYNRDGKLAADEWFDFGNPTPTSIVPAPGLPARSVTFHTEQTLRYVKFLRLVIAWDMLPGSLQPDYINDVNVPTKMDDFLGLYQGASDAYLFSIYNPDIKL